MLNNEAEQMDKGNRNKYKLSLMVGLVLMVFLAGYGGFTYYKRVTANKEAAKEFIITRKYSIWEEARRVIGRNIGDAISSGLVVVTVGVPLLIITLLFPKLRSTVLNFLK